MLGAILCSALLLATDDGEVLDAGPEAPLVPFYVPRSVSLGFFAALGREQVSPHFRVQWEGMFFDQPPSALGWFVNFGSGVGVNPPTPATAHYQHAAVAGVVYASDRRWFHWGFQVGFGPVWYRAFFAPDTFRPENYVLPYVEGRVQAGVRVHPHVRLALYLGYGSPVNFPRGRNGALLVGGLDFGVLVDWR